LPRLGKAGEHGEFGLLEFGLFPPVDCPGRLDILGKCGGIPADPNHETIALSVPQILPTTIAR